MGITLGISASCSIPDQNGDFPDLHPAVERVSVIHSWHTRRGSLWAHAFGKGVCVRGFEVKFVGRLALASTLGVSVTLGSLSIASASSRPGTAHTGSAHSSTIQFSGQVASYTAASGTTAGSLTLTDPAGATLIFSTSATTAITQIGGSGATLAVDDFATVQAPVVAPKDASSITFSAAAPVSFSGIVTDYTAPSGDTSGSVTIVRRDGTSLMYSVAPSTVITENGGGNSAIAVGDFASIQAAPAAPSVALAIAFDAATSVRFDGRVTAYSAASVSTPGSITLQKNSESATFATSSSTVITGVGDSRNTLAVGDWAEVFATSALANTAQKIRFTPSSRSLHFSGRVTAYTAPSGGTDGALTVRRRDRATVTYVVTSSTILTEVGGSGDTIAARDPVTVEIDPGSTTVATEIYFKTAAPPPSPAVRTRSPIPR